MIHIYIKFSNHELPIRVLLDIRASSCFFDKDFVSRHNLIFVKKNYYAFVQIIDDQPLASKNDTNENETLKMALGD